MKKTFQTNIAVNDPYDTRLCRYRIIIQDAGGRHLGFLHKH